MMKTKKQFGARSFQYAGAKLWNELPEHVKASKSLVFFKENPEKLYFHQCL